MAKKDVNIVKEASGLRSVCGNSNVLTSARGAALTLKFQSDDICTGR